MVDLARVEPEGVGEQRFLVFSVGDRLFALSAEEVDEVVRLPALAKVPQAPPSLRGLANLRGRIVPVASVRALLGGDPSADVGTKLALILAGKAPVALSLDEAPELVTASDLQTQDAGVVARPGERLRAIFKIDDGRVAHVLDIQALLAAAFVPRAARDREARGQQGGMRADAGANDVSRGKIISFLVAGQEFALELDCVQEVILAPAAVTAVPHAEDLVLGVTAYRQSLLPLLSLRGLLGLGGDHEAARSKVIVSSIGGTLVGLLADQAKAIVPIDEDRSEPPPPVLAARTGAESQIKAIYRTEDGGRLISILAPEQLFRDDVMQRLTRAQSGAAQPAAAGDVADQAEDNFLVFRLGEDEFALPIEAVIEVARIPAQITKVPKTPDFLEGVISFRGEVLPVVDQRRRFDMPVLAGDDRRRLVVVRSERHRAALIVDAVSEVLSNPKGEIDPAPDLSGQQTRLVHGVINLEASGRMVMVLDPVELLSRAERGLLDAFEPELSDAR